MSLSILDATTQAAVSAATTKVAQLDALSAAWEGGNVNAWVYDSGDVLLQRRVQGPWTINGTPELVSGALVSFEHVATGTPAYTVYRTADTAIFRRSGGTWAGTAKALCAVYDRDVAFTGSSGLPIDSGSLTIGAQITTMQAFGSSAGTYTYSATVMPARGAVPSGSTIGSSGDSTLRASILSTWDDGSAAVAVVSGSVTVDGTNNATIPINVATGSGGTALGASAISALVSSVAVDLDTYGTITLTDFSAPERVWWANARTVCARYRQAAPSPGSTALEAVVDIHAWAGRALVEVVVENCRFDATASSPTAPAAATYTGATVAINGSTVATVNSSGAPETEHSPFRSWYASGWVGGNPGLRVTQAHADLQAHPALWQMAEDNTADLSGYASDAYAPWGTGRQRATNMGATGDHDSIGPLTKWQAQAVQSGDRRAWNAVEVNDLALLGYAINYRHTSGLVPDASHLTGKSQQTTAGNAGHWPGLGSGGDMEWETGHSPSAGLLGFLSRPSPTFIELAQKIAVWNGTYSTSTSGFSVTLDDNSGVLTKFGGNRVRAWGMRALAHATLLSPDGSSWRAGGQTWMRRNREVMQDFQDSARATLGLVWSLAPEDYSDHQSSMAGGSTAMWQHHYCVTEWHKAAELRLLAGSEQAALESVADWLALQPVRWVNEQPTGAWRYVPYSAPVSSSDTEMLSEDDWATQMDLWHSDSPASVSGGWFTSTGDTPTSYASYSSNASAGALYPSYLWDALRAAVERGVAGAATAWATVQNNVTGLSTWLQGFRTDPRWGSTPREGALPAWIASATTGEWVEVPNSQPSLAAGLVPAVSGSMGNLGQRGTTDAYCGAFIHSGKFYIHGGGHADYGGNEVGCIDLLQASPAWDLLVERTPVADLLGASNYYNDGLPTSRHTYYGMHVVPIGGVPHMLRINYWMGFAFNGPPVGGATGVRTTEVDAFNLVTNAWLPAEYDFTTIPASGSESAMCQDAETGDIWHWAGSTNRVWKVAASDLSVTNPADLAGTEGIGGALAFDSENQRLVRFAGRGSATVAYYDVALGTKVSPTLTGPDAAELSGMSGAHHGWGIAHDTLRNVVYLIATSLSDSATDIPEGTMYRVRLSDWYVQKITPGGETPAEPPNGIWGRMKYVPELDAVVYLPAWQAPMLAMRCY